ncbi:MAG TPA: hypothetical protein VNS09_13165 [Solirubrobacter sp.]|nr:hypothetical protein [Solirubrobacter sp.]
MGDHLIVMHSAVRALPGYSRHEAPSILMDGSSLNRASEHGRAVTAQLERPQNTLDEALHAAIVGLSAAGIPRAIRGQARNAIEDYFYSRLELDPARPLDPHAPLPHSLEPLSDGMYRALADVVELVVDGDYETLHELSGNHLAVEDLRRRVEDECPEALVLPPREHYGVEAITRSEDLEDEGWAFFLDLWTEDGPARLHIEGALVLTAEERFLVALSDIQP